MSSDSPVFQVIPNSASPALVELRPGSGCYVGTLRVPADGFATLYFHSPRPLRCWVGRHLVAEDTLQHISYFLIRRMRLAACLPLEAGEHVVRIEVEPRIRHSDEMDQGCPSMMRRKIAEDLTQRIPDRIDVSLDFERGSVGPACALRFEWGQFRRDGRLWQEVWVRGLPGFHRLTLATEGDPGGPAAWRYAVRSAKAPDLEAHISPPLPLRPPTERRCFVPVTGPGEELPLARPWGAKDDRPEPERTVVGETTITIAGHEGPAATFRMPVYESAGKLAPKHEFTHIPAPRFDDVWATVPKPVLPPEWSDLGQLYRGAWELLCRLWREADPASGLPNGHTGTADKAFENQLFVWDTCFGALGTAYGWRTFPAQATLDCLYSRQEDGGNIEREHNTRNNLPTLCEPGFGPNPPLMIVAEVQLARLTGDTARLRAAYPALAAHFRWLENNRRQPDGTYWTTGLASGLDNSPAQGLGYPDLTAQMVHYAELLAGIAAELGLREDQAAFLRSREESVRLLNTLLWSDAAGCYCATLPEGGHNLHKSVVTFWPLWANAVPPDRIAKLESLALDPACFNRLHPLPSLSADSPLFSTKGEYWRGSVWSATNYAALKGFWRSGRTGLARDFALRHLQTVQKLRETTDGVFWENYCPDQIARGLPWCGRDFLWSAGVPVALLLEVVLGLEPDALSGTLAWTPPDMDGVGVRDYPLGAATISLLQRIENRRRVISVETDRPFSLVIRLGSREERRALPAGTGTIQLPS